MSTIIQAENIGKKYLLSHQKQGSYTALRDVIAEKFKAAGRRVLHPFSSNRSPFTDSEDFWALKDVSFEINQGDRVGIIGRNGAGKSTLLKILSRITEPTTGRVTLEGRVASLLEVGTGFHPELTGRENIYLNGAILGMSRAEIKKKFDEIVAFAEVEKFLDTPVKRYSSGMYVRLAFAVAAHLEPEILVVDEVLAVGDIQFQKKCLGKMQEVSAKEGRTVLFVSHNLEAVKKLCNQGILLEKGQIVSAGETNAILHKYLSTGLTEQAEFILKQPVGKEIAGFASKLVIENENGQPVNEIPVGRPWQIRVFFKINRKLEHFIIAIGFSTEMNTPLRTAFSKPQPIERGEYTATFRENSILLSPGYYPLIVGLSSYENSFHYVNNAGTLVVSEISQGIDLIKTRGTGIILNPMEVNIGSTNG